MKTWKFENLLEKKALFFSRADKLEDKFEGSVTKNLTSGGGEIDSIDNMRKAFLPYTYLNCWHVNEHESDAMWKLYLHGNDGVAIQSTFKKLETSIPSIESKIDGNVGFGLVNYIDYETFPMKKTNNLLPPFFYKRINFEHEKEFRLIIQIIPHLKPVNGTISGHVDLDGSDMALQRPPGFDFPKEGKFQEINLEQLIESIVISPISKSGFKQSIESIANKYGIKKPVRVSELKKNPTF